MAKDVVSVRLDPEVHALVKELATEKHWSVSQWIALAASEAVDRERPRLRRKAATRR